MMIFKGRNRVTQAYGNGHSGIDIVGDDDRTVRCVVGGVVDMVQFWDGKTRSGSQSYGNLVRVKAGAFYFYYAHLASIAVKLGDKLSAGAAIGVMGSTGNSTGAHTHFELRVGSTKTADRVDPSAYCGVKNVRGTYNDVAAPTPSQTEFYAACSYAGSSIVDALKSIGVDSSYKHRAVIAARNGVKGYRGTPAQNIDMLELLKAGKLKKA